MEYEMVELGGLVGLVVSGYLVKFSGFDETLTTQLPETIVRVRLFEHGVPVIGFLIGLILLKMYSIDESEAYAIRSTLEAQRVDSRG